MKIRRIKLFSSKDNENKEGGNKDKLVNAGIITAGLTGTGLSINSARKKINKEAKDSIKSAKKAADLYQNKVYDAIKFNRDYLEESFNNSTNPLKHDIAAINGKEFKITKDDLDKIDEYNKKIKEEVNRSYKKILEERKKEVRENSKNLMKSKSLKRATAGVALTGAALGGYNLYKKDKKDQK